MSNELTTDRRGIEIVRYSRRNGTGGWMPVLWHVTNHACGAHGWSGIAAVAHVVEIPHSMCALCVPELARRIAVRS